MHVYFDNLLVDLGWRKVRVVLVLIFLELERRKGGKGLVRERKIIGLVINGELEGLGFNQLDLQREKLHELSDLLVVDVADDLSE